MHRPLLSNLWNAFPDHLRYPTLKDLYTMLGGAAQRNINVSGFGPTGNTCASRISYAFNHGGAPISSAIGNNVGAETLGTSDGHRIIFKVRHLRLYLLQMLGKPLLDNVRPYDDAFRAKQGIIAFTVEGWGDASGHIALLRHGMYREPAHDNYSALSVGDVHTERGEFWELP